MHAYISFCQRLVMRIHVGNGGILPFNYCVQMVVLLLEGCSKCPIATLKKDAQALQVRAIITLKR